MVLNTPLCFFPCMKKHWLKEFPYSYVSMERAKHQMFYKDICNCWKCLQPLIFFFFCGAGGMGWEWKIPAIHNYWNLVSIFISPTIHVLETKCRYVQELGDQSPQRSRIKDLQLSSELFKLFSLYLLACGICSLQYTA